MDDDPPNPQPQVPPRFLEVIYLSRTLTKGVKKMDIAVDDVKRHSYEFGPQQEYSLERERIGSKLRIIEVLNICGVWHT